MRLKQQLRRSQSAARMTFRPVLRRDLLQIAAAAWIMASLAGVALAWSNSDANASKHEAAHSTQKLTSLGQSMTEDSSASTNNNLSLQVNHSNDGTNVTNSTTVNSSSSSTGNASSSSQLTVNGENVPIPPKGSVDKTITSNNGSVHVSVDNSSTSSNNSSLNINVQSSSNSDNSAP